MVEITVAEWNPNGPGVLTTANRGKVLVGFGGVIRSAWKDQMTDDAKMDEDELGQQ